MAALKLRQGVIGTGTLASNWSRKNGFNLLRLLLAALVVASHTFPLGFGKKDLWSDFSQGQTSAGGVAVSGFFVLSGLLITRSGSRLGLGRFVWHRALRILPGLWVCLLLTAFVMAPLVARHEHEHWSAFLNDPAGPFQYLVANWSAGSTQYGISGLLVHVPHPYAFNGSLWTLRFEMACYVVVAVLAATTLLRRARWTVPVLLSGIFALQVMTSLSFTHLRMPSYAALYGLHSSELPFLGPRSVDYLLPLLFAFLLGAAAELYRDRMPVNAVLAGASLIVTVGTMRFGGFALLGIPALAYLLIWLAVRMPAPLARIGSTHDYSYGLYIYAFLVQQGLALLGYARWGVIPYFALSLGGAMVLAVLSWHLVEKPALRLKNARLRHPDDVADDLRRQISTAIGRTRRMRRFFRALLAWPAKSKRRLWIGAFLTFFALSGAWSIATPLMASPDEPAHVIHAAAVVRGQFSGPEVMQKLNVANVDTTWAVQQVKLPEWYGRVNAYTDCIRDHQTTYCATKLRAAGSDRTVETTTSAGRYNPLYYLAVGWPSLFNHGPFGAYLMRWISAALGAALLACALVTASESRRPALAQLSVLAAATPMTIFLNSVVNPNGLEISAALLCWTATLAVLMDPKPELLRRRLFRIGAAGVILLEIRPLGLLWIGGILFFGVLVAERGAIATAVRDSAARVWAAVLVAAAVSAKLWDVLHPDHSSIQAADWLRFIPAAKHTFLSTGDYFQQMIGVFGWLDASSPFLTAAFWIGVIVLLVLLALTCARWREIVSLSCLAATTVFLPVLAQGMQAHNVGMIWQGRYLLPFAVGLPVLATAVIVKRSPGAGLLRPRLYLMLGTLLAVAQFVAFFWTLRIYTVGMNGSLVIGHAYWAPPAGWLLWTVVAAVGCLGTLWLLRAYCGERTVRPLPAGEAGHGVDASTAVDSTKLLTA